MILNGSLLSSIIYESFVYSLIIGATTEICSSCLVYFWHWFYAWCALFRLLQDNDCI